MELSAYGEFTRTTEEPIDGVLFVGQRESYSAFEGWDALADVVVQAEIGNRDDFVLRARPDKATKKLECPSRSRAGWRKRCKLRHYWRLMER